MRSRHLPARGSFLFRKLFALTFGPPRNREIFVKYSNVQRFLFFRFDGTTFSSTKSSTYSHKRVVSLGNYRGQPFTVGGAGDTWVPQTDTEILSISTDTWRSGTKYHHSNG